MAAQLGSVLDWSALAEFGPRHSSICILGSILGFAGKERDTSKGSHLVNELPCSLGGCSKGFWNDNMNGGV